MKPNALNLIEVCVLFEFQKNYLKEADRILNFKQVLEFYKPDSTDL